MSKGGRREAAAPGPAPQPRIMVPGPLYVWGSEELPVEMPELEGIGPGGCIWRVD